jgi:oligopeptide transport system substrate-binding protein
MHNLGSLSLRLLVSAALAGVVAAGCGGGGSSGTAPGVRTLTVATENDVRTVDPAQAFDTWSTAVVHAITRRLVDYDPKGKLVADLAERWTVGDGGKTYTFQLKQGEKFADGTPIQAQHFKDALDRVRDPATASTGSGFYSGIASVEAPGPETLVVRLEAPDPTLLNLMGMTFAAPILKGQDPRKPAASGPYALEEYEEGERVVLSKNPHDTRHPAAVDRIVLELEIQEPLQMTRLRNGEVDLLAAIPPAEYASIVRDPAEADHIAQGVVNQTWYFGMNTTRPPWNDPKVRRAALLALDRTRHLARGGVPANGILPPHVPGYDPGRKLPPQDLAAARKLLAEAGYGGGGPQGRKPVMWLANTDQYRYHAELIQADLSVVGIVVELKPVTLSQYLAGYRTSADCWYGGWYPDFPDAGNFLEPVLHGRNIGPGKSNAARYNNPHVNELLDRAHSLPGEGGAREALYRQAEDLLLQDLPWIPLYFEVETRYFRDGVSGVVVHPVWRQMLTGIEKK